MMVHGFDMYRVFISAPGDLESEKQLCREAISEVNQNVAMPQKVLLVSVGLPHDDQIVGYRAAVADNVRQCSFFIQVFQDDWGPKDLFRKMYYLAEDCRADESVPMRDLVVCLKAAPRETDVEILAFRKELEERPGVKVVRFDSIAELKSQLVEVCRGWVESVSGSAAVV